MGKQKNKKSKDVQADSAQDDVQMPVCKREKTYTIVRFPVKVERTIWQEAKVPIDINIGKPRCRKCLKQEKQKTADTGAAKPVKAAQKVKPYTIPAAPAAPVDAYTSNNKGKKKVKTGGCPGGGCGNNFRF